MLIKETLTTPSYSIPYVAWDSPSTVRRDLSQRYPVRIKIKCKCGRSLGFLYGFHDRPVEHYAYAHTVPRKIVANAASDFECHCGRNHSPSYPALKLAYAKAAAVPHGVLVLPYDLQPVAG